MADSLIWSRYTSPTEDIGRALALPLSKISFQSCEESEPLQVAVNRVKAEVLQSAHSRNVIVVTGRSRRTIQPHTAELQRIAEGGSSVGSSILKTLGVVGALVATGTNASLLILQEPLST
jgi:hypothetical protein